MEPAGHSLPGGTVQFPLHVDELSPLVAPNRPLGQARHSVKDPVLYRPAEQRPEQVAFTAPGVVPDVPGGQLVQGLLPPRPYFPIPHRTLLSGEMAPGPHSLPGATAQPPLQADVVRPLAPPNTPTGQVKQEGRPRVLKVPGGQSPAHSAEGRPTPAPEVPAGQGWQARPSPVLYWPGLQGVEESEVAAGPQNLPGATLQFPLQAGEVRLYVSPNVPMGHWLHTAAPAKL